MKYALAGLIGLLCGMCLMLFILNHPNDAAQQRLALDWLNKHQQWQYTLCNIPLDSDGANK